MNQPWTEERSVPAELARELIGQQFPELAQARVEPFGAGWDNTAYRVGGEWVFRFPRRRIAVELIETECRVLPLLGPHLPLAVPLPERVGRPSERYPWPFAGYRMLPGETACRARLDAGQRAAAAEPLGRFLAALHGAPADELRTAGAPADTLGRLDLAKRIPQVEERLDELAGAGAIESPGPWRWIVDEAPADWTPGDATPVHGDFYGRHLLVDARRQPCGVIDWGDVHLGDPAVDLSIAHGFLPPAARAAFRAAYGPIDEPTWRMARFRALHSAVVISVYGHAVADEALAREGRAALTHLRG